MKYLKNRAFDFIVASNFKNVKILTWVIICSFQANSLVAQQLSIDTVELEAENMHITTYARFVPERKDDFAWENDKIAFRAYGPALREGNENSGIDCWLKRVDYPIIDKWYKQSKQGKSYHKDHGEGLDCYHVGSSAGCGGTGIWIDHKRRPLNTYTKYIIEEASTERTQFKLTYECDIDGHNYIEEKTIAIELGKRLFKVNSKFLKDGKPAANLPICIGLTTHDGKAETFSEEKKGWVACWEEMKGTELGTAIKMNSNRIKLVEIIQSEIVDQSHIFIISATNKKGELSYHAGYGWTKAGEINNKNDWKNYLNKSK